MTAYALAFAPHVPVIVLWLLAGLAAALTVYAFFDARARGLGARRSLSPS